MASPHTRFHENLPIGSKVISGVHTDKTDGQTDTDTETHTHRLVI
jgi:hypothetical protein